jgi:prolyl-tRNA editing enzyme YbaK/EbsC (Cys-tRNA(Pro) deacylase)
MSEFSAYHKTVCRIVALLRKHDVPFKTFEHQAVRTSEEAAAVRPEYSIAQGAKALIVRVKLRNKLPEKEKQFVQIVVAGDKKFNPKRARTALGAKDIRFATEEEVKEITEGVMPGGVPPFGNLFGLSVYVDESLFNNKDIIFNAGDREFSIAMSAEDYQRIVKPHVVSITEF